jgi:hypothetical protein
MGLGITIEKSEARAQRREGRRPVRRPAPLCRASRERGLTLVHVLPPFPMFMNFQVPDDQQ